MLLAWGKRTIAVEEKYLAVVSVSPPLGSYKDITHVKLAYKLINAIFIAGQVFDIRHRGGSESASDASGMAGSPPARYGKSTRSRKAYGSKHARWMKEMVQVSHRIVLDWTSLCRLRPEAAFLGKG